jgi:hypothetical protein
MRASYLLSHLLWREADTHTAVRDALQARFGTVVDQVRAVIMAASTGSLPVAAVDTASGLLALAVSYRHSVARHGVSEDVASSETMDREVDFVAGALTGPSAPAPLAQ